MMTFLPVLGWAILLAALAAGAAYPSFRRSTRTRSRMTALAESAFALFLLIPAAWWVSAKLFHVRVDILPVLAIFIATWLFLQWRLH